MSVFDPPNLPRCNCLTQARNIQWPAGNAEWYLK